MVDVPTTADLAADSGASLIGFAQPATGTVSRTIDEKLREHVTPEDFGAAGDGMTDDTDAIRAAIAYVLVNPQHTLRFANTSYLVGSSVAYGDSIFTLDGANGVTIRGRPKFIVTDTNSVQKFLFDIRMSDVDIEYIEAIGDPWDVPDLATALTMGVITCWVQSPSGDTLTDHRFGVIKATNAWGALQYDANPQTYGRARNVRVGRIEATECIYGFGGANSPDRHEIEQISCHNVFRGYFVYGLSDGKAYVAYSHYYPTEMQSILNGGTCANITVYTDNATTPATNRTGDTCNIDVTVQNLSGRPSLQLSTASMDPSDTNRGMYNVRAVVFSTSGSALKVANSAWTGSTDPSTPYASPKRNIVVHAYNSADGASLSQDSYGLWSNAEELRLECSNFLDNGSDVRESYLSTGWQIRDLQYGLEIPHRLAVGNAGETSFRAVARYDDPHLRIGDSGVDTFWEAHATHYWLLNGTAVAWMGSSIFAPVADATMASGTSTSRWAESYAVSFYPGAGTARWTSGAGSPEGTVTAPVGSLYTRTDGSTGTTLYAKETGSGATGWAAK